MRTTIAAALVLAALLAACSSDDDGPRADSDTTATATASGEAASSPTGATDGGDATASAQSARELATWRAFKNMFWPAKYLISVDGLVRYEHFGEGDYANTDLAIREALTAAGRNVSAIAVGSVEPQVDPAADRQTRELYGGYQRNYNARGLYAAQHDYYVYPHREFDYQDINTSSSERKHHQWYVLGLWRNEREPIVHARTTTQLEDYLALRFVARSVNVVLSPPPGDPFTVVLELDGRPLLPAEVGPDVTFDEEGRSLIVVDSAHVYAIVELPEWGDHELKLRSDSASFAIFAFTFGNYLEGV